MKKIIVIAMVVLIYGANSCREPQENNQTQTDKTTNSMMQAEWTKDKVIYEVNLRQYSEEGTLAAFEKHLDRLKSLGVDILWFMPIHPVGVKDRKGTYGSYYSVKDYYAIDSLYGTMDEFKAMVKKIHDMGMYVIIDWVANHTSRDNKWITEHPDWYNHDSSGNIIAPYDWSDVADLNYDNPDMRKEMIKAMAFWLRETGIDGFRCDVAMLVPVDFWNEARLELQTIKPDLFMLAEAEEPPLQEKAFDMYYGWSLHQMAKDIAKKEKNVADLEQLLAQKDSLFPDYTYRMNFTSNHDENSWNGTAFERFGDALALMNVMMFTLPDMPLIYSGQEAGLNKKLEFFEKDNIEWKESHWTEFYRKLIALKKQNPALWNGNYGGDVVRIHTNDDSLFFSFSREKDGSLVWVIMNFSDTKAEVEISSGLLNGVFTDYFTGDVFQAEKGSKFNLNPWAYKVLVK